MDPFRQDPDVDDESPHPLHSSQRLSQSLTRGDAAGHDLGKGGERLQEGSMTDEAEVEDGDGPPPSVMLDIPPSVSDKDRRSLYGDDEDDDDDEDGDETLGHHVRESVRLGTMTKPNAEPSSVSTAAGKAARKYNDDADGADDDEEQDETVPYDEEDEEAGLMDRRYHASSSSSASTSRNSVKGKERRRAPSRRREGGGSIIADLTDRVRRKANKIRQQDTSARKRQAMRGLDPKERALWNWANVDNLDDFLQEVYTYYIGKGIFCIALSRALNLLTIGFVVGFSTFLAGCVNYGKIREYSKLRHSQSPQESEVDLMLSDVLVEQCVSRFSGLTLLVFITFVAFYGWQVIRFAFGLSRLVAMNNFYTHLLNIPDAEVQSIPWNEVVSRISHLRETHPITSLSSSMMQAGAQGDKLDAHDVANRIMRQENYLIALFNKDVLDLTIPLPGLRLRPPALTKSLEWNLTFSLLGFLFDRRGQVRRQFITSRKRDDLIEGLRRRFIFMAAVNAVFAPFIVVYLLLYSFFRYFEEYHKNPASLGSRQYTQFARWKFREFNELPHLFRRRCHESYPFAQRYLDQFPKERTAIVARFVSFIAGSFMAVLLLASVIDWDLVVHLYITPQYNVLFFITVFTAILAVSRGLVPDDQQTFEPEVLLQGVVERTHYLPEHWKGRFHSTEVHSEFASLYQLKISIFVSELLSVIVTPFVLYKSLPRSAPAIIDFFREFTVHIDGLGYVCSFAVFDFARHGNVKFGAPGGYRDGRMASKEGKMEQSLLGFRAANPDWHPSDPVASLFLSRVGAAETTSPRQRQGAYAKENGGGGSAGGGGGGAVASSSYTPANSTLAQRSQLYNEAFERSISLAKPGNAAALQASAIKTGPRSHAHTAKQPNKTLQAVHEDDDAGPLAFTTARLSEVDEEETGESGYADARFGRSTSLHRAAVDGSIAGVGAAGDDTSLRGLLNHIGGRW